MRRWGWKWSRRLGGAFLLFLLMDLCVPLPALKPYCRMVLARDGSMLHASLSSDDKWRMHTRMEEVPAELVAALVAKEDRWFWWHPGVNPVALGRAAVSNVVAGERMSGASTITMQLARMLEPKPRTLWGKVKEMFRAVQLEWHYSKQEILEMYLSYLPYGGNVEGVKAASHLYFGRPPERLSLSQSIVLTVIPNRPNSLRPDVHPEALTLARDKWARRFAEEGVFDGADLDDALAEPVAGRRMELATVAPQFCRRVLAEHGGTQVQSTLDPQLQAKVERLLKNHVERAAKNGVGNGAVLVVDNLTMEVLAYCGSADFENKGADGEVDAIHALRSPGSTLKPFLYAEAFERGLLTPKMKVLDVPFEAAGYMPVNYDKTCTGEVSAEYALRHSLNLPSVRLLYGMGLRPFVSKLMRAGFAGIGRNQKELGLSVVLGGCGVRLDELVPAYAAFARGGQQAGLRFVREAGGDGRGGKLCSPEVAYLVTDVLAGLERPDLPQGLLERSKLPRVAWKTGTSYGRRDAWAIGYNPRYTVGVWMGNMDGRGVQGLSGAVTATPLLIEVFNAMATGVEKEWFRVPQGVERRAVCSVTGLLPSGNCPHRVNDLRIKGRSPLQVCGHVKSIYTDWEGKTRYCPACLPSSGWKQASYLDLAPELLGWMQRQGLQVPLPPPHAEQCTAVFAGAGPQIVSPRADGEYWVPDGESLVLHAAAPATSSRLYWYANDVFLGSTATDGKLAYTPADGRLRIACMDDQGQMARIAVRVRRF